MEAGPRAKESWRAVNDTVEGAIIVPTVSLLRGSVTARYCNGPGGLVDLNVFAQTPELRGVEERDSVSGAPIRSGQSRLRRLREWGRRGRPPKASRAATLDVGSLQA